jgi:hypothetical protein
MAQQFPDREDQDKGSKRQGQEQEYRPLPLEGKREDRCHPARVSGTCRADYEKRHQRIGEERAAIAREHRLKLPQRKQGDKDKDKPQRRPSEPRARQPEKTRLSLLQPGTFSHSIPFHCAAVTLPFPAFLSKAQGL